MHTYFATGHLQVADLEVVVHKFNEEHPCIYACFCGYSRVYVGEKEISGPNSR